MLRSAAGQAEPPRRDAERRTLDRRDTRLDTRPDTRPDTRLDGRSEETGSACSPSRPPLRDVTEL